MSLVLTWPDDAPATYHAPLRVGYSGGLDSGVLLHRLANDPVLRARGLRAIHVHHGLHADADAWAAHCQRTCATLGVPLAVVHVDVDREAGEGLEAAARQARFAAFSAALDEGDVLVLAHHRDDQAETFLLRALRASGIDGLGAMRDWRRFARGWLWRPLLATPRTALQAYAQAHALQWIDDPSNLDDAHDRNFLRNNVLPLLRERWPRADAAFATTSTLQREAADLLEEEDARALASARGVDPAVLQVPALRALPVARQARVLRRWVATLGLPPLPSTGIARVMDELLAADPTDAGTFAWQGASIRRWRDGLWASAASPSTDLSTPLAWDGRVPLPLPGGGALAFEPGMPVADAQEPHLPFAMPLRVHARTGGERIVLPGREHGHALKHVLQDLGVPPWLRAQLPLLSDSDGQLLAAGDLAISARLDAWLRASGRRLRWLDADAP